VREDVRCERESDAGKGRHVCLEKTLVIG
jgi:hypothetical protein